MTRTTGTDEKGNLYRSPTPHHSVYIRRESSWSVWSVVTTMSLSVMDIIACYLPLPYKKKLIRQSCSYGANGFGGCFQYLSKIYCVDVYIGHLRSFGIWREYWTR